MATTITSGWALLRFPRAPWATSRSADPHQRTAHGLRASDDAQPIQPRTDRVPGGVVPVPDQGVRTVRGIRELESNSAWKDLEAAPGFEPACRGQLEAGEGLPAGAGG